MKKNTILRLLLIFATVFVLFVVICSFGLNLGERRYQRDMDEVRRKHVDVITDVLMRYTNKTKHLPFQELAQEKPFMVLIGHSPQEEDTYASDPVMSRGGQWTNASTLEKLLSKELGETVRLPRDRQTVATYAPNIYVYFVSKNQMSVACHLYYPYEGAKEIEWRGGKFYSYAITYTFNPAD